MKDTILRELVAKFRKVSEEPETTDGSPSAAIRNAREDGWRLGVRESANALEKLIDVLGDE